MLESVKFTGEEKLLLNFMSLEFIYVTNSKDHKAHEDITYHTNDGISVETNSKLIKQIQGGEPTSRPRANNG